MKDIIDFFRKITLASSAALEEFWGDSEGVINEYAKKGEQSKALHAVVAREGFDQLEELRKKVDKGVAKVRTVAEDTLETVKGEHSDETDRKGKSHQHSPHHQSQTRGEA